MKEVILFLQSAVVFEKLISSRAAFVIVTVWVTQLTSPERSYAVLPVINNTQRLSSGILSSPTLSLFPLLFLFLLLAFTLSPWEMSKAKRNHVSAQKCQYWQPYLSMQSLCVYVCVCLHVSLSKSFHLYMFNKSKYATYSFYESITSNNPICFTFRDKYKNIPQRYFTHKNF